MVPGRVRKIPALAVAGVFVHLSVEMVVGGGPTEPSARILAIVLLPARVAVPAVGTDTRTQQDPAHDPAREFGSRGAP